MAKTNESHDAVPAVTQEPRAPGLGADERFSEFMAQLTKHVQQNGLPERVVSDIAEQDAEHARRLETKDQEISTRTVRINQLIIVLSIAGFGAAIGTFSWLQVPAATVSPLVVFGLGSIAVLMGGGAAAVIAKLLEK